MRFLVLLFLIAGSSVFSSERNSLPPDGALITEHAGEDVRQAALVSVDPGELFSAVALAMETDPRHVYPLLLLARDGSNDGMYFEGSMTQVAVPKDLTRQEASALISFAYDENGAYRGWAEFNERLQAYLISTEMRLKDSAMIDVQFVASGEASGRIRIVTSERAAACRVDGDEPFEALLESRPVTDVPFTTIVKSRVSFEDLIGQP